MLNNPAPIALITGASGFVGSHLARHLQQQGWQIHLLTRPNSVLPALLNDVPCQRHAYDGSTDSVLQAVADSRPTVVFHLASLFLSQHQSRDVAPLMASNVLFGSQLLEAMQVHGVTRLMNTGTSWQHYQNADYNPVCLYAATKQAFEAVLQYYVAAHGLRAITLKLFDTYGPADPRPKLFHLLQKTAQAGQPLDMSAGEQLIDIVHIDDVCAAYQLAAQRLLNDLAQGHESYAVSSGQPLPLKDLVALYAQVTGQNVPINWGARPYRPREVMQPWHSGQPVPGWQPRIALAEGMRRVHATHD